jgi:hypothetical protein
MLGRGRTDKPFPERTAMLARYRTGVGSVLDSGTFTNFEIGSARSRDFVPLDVSIGLEVPARRGFFCPAPLVGTATIFATQLDGTG